VQNERQGVAGVRRLRRFNMEKRCVSGISRDSRNLNREAVWMPRSFEPRLRRSAAFTPLQHGKEVRFRNFARLQESEPWSGM